MTTRIEYGSNLLPQVLPESKRRLVITTPPILEYVQARMCSVDATFELAPSMDERTLAAWEHALPDTDAVLGIGGGVCLDAAKYVAWRRSLPLWLAPSVVSVDACLTEAIAVRHEGRVRYIGEVYPEAVVVDYSLIQSAPTHLNRAGAGDILSIHTALWDWQVAAQEKGERYDSAIADQSARLLARLDEAADEVRAVTEAGIRTLVELFAAEVALCRQAGNSRPEEGSEHFWAYNVEYRTRRHFAHGELVTLGALLMATLQQNRAAALRTLVHRLGIRWRPEEIGISREEVIGALITARDYAASEQLPFSAVNARDISKEPADQLVYEVCDSDKD